MKVAPERLHVIPYGVRLESFFPDGEPTSGSFNVLFAGTVSLRKGFPYLLQAFAKVRHSGKRLRVAGAISEDVRGLLGSLPLEHVEFLGSVTQDHLRRLMSGSDVMVLPSIEEGLALVQAQALACGCPVICTTATGGEDLFTDGEEGFIVPVKDPDALTSRMQQLADDPELARTMRHAALIRVRQIGGWREYGDRWEALLQQLTGKS